MNVVEIYQAVADKVKQEQNGNISISSFNIKSKSAEVRLLDYISGDVEGVKPPDPYNNQKLKDWLSYFLIATKGVVEGGLFPKPANYYMNETFSVIGSWKDEDCGEEVMVTGCDTTIEVLDCGVYDSRCGTYIKSLKPSMKKPVAKIVGNNFVCNPSDLGSVQLTYKRYPVFGQVVVKIDPVYNDEVPDTVNSINYEWPDFARGLLVWFIAQQYSTGNRERALTEQLQVEQKSVRQ